ncbi:MAG: type II/IV secretion system protein [Candidatus Pacebacteria bacterium]|nr:type II/IV secretion system protein [Candidatus Paceibacterota bacterium]
MERGLNYLNGFSAPVKIDALKIIPEEKARSLGVAIIESHGSILGVASIDPESSGALGLLKELKDKGYEFKIFLVSKRALERIFTFYKFTSEKSSITSRVNIEKERIIFLIKELQNIQKTTKFILDFNYDKSSVAEFLEIVLSGALANKASDIHFEPEEDSIKLRYRIDGVLRDVATEIRRNFYPSVISRIKLLCNLKINISDKAQDGRFTIGLTEKDIELRVAIAPSEFGEIVVMRVLDPDSIKITLPQLGFRKDDLEIIEVELKRPNGMILNTGPTGSGKTTTLYAFLKHKANPEIKIITIEDPIEYHLKGIEQTQVNDEAGYTFANGLRSLMRQDPDVILVGEVRDKETAEISIGAALTGHLVFSTIHANEASLAIPRLVDLDVKPQSIGPALNLIIAQRLLRKLCESCKIPKTLDKTLEAKIRKLVERLPKRVDKEPYKNIKIFEASKCEKCNNSGYRGRVGIYELFLNDPGYEKMVNGDLSGVDKLESHEDVEDLIKRQVGGREMKEYAISHGMVTMQEDGILKIISGQTDFAELEDVTGTILW